MAEGVTPGLATCLYFVGGVAITIGALGTFANMGDHNYAGATLGLGTVIGGLLFCAIAGVLTRLHRAVYHLGRCSIWLERIDESVQQLNHDEDEEDGPEEPQPTAEASAPEKPISQEELDRRFESWQQKER